MRRLSTIRRHVSTAAAVPPATAARLRLRQLLSEERVAVPASVYDPLSARMAERMGYPIIQLAGSVASNAVLGAPDLMLLTHTELAGLCRRITRAAPSAPLVVDADDGFGNALGVGRCVQELEAAGVSGLSIEDSQLPARYGTEGKPLQGSAGGYNLTSVEEGVARVRAALDARTDPNTVIIARTSAFARSGIDGLLERVPAYVAAGAAAIHIIGKVGDAADLGRLQEAAAGTPLMLSGAQIEGDADLAKRGVRIRLAGHPAFMAAQKAAYEALREKAPAGDVPEWGSGTLRSLLDVDEWQRRQRDYLGIANPAEGMK
eukprot:TRINITY_DN15499_c0_g1_i1.p1 TRINITY_DN15499_c0_g1~~TRINITY_DN15499_c0_g1_i1.p1  ORF type:complete len:341 (+),score=121.35 TRINITY_DN15499_c0_g1_i1:72-1025(+)